MPRHTFELNDRDGKPHSYIVDAHPGGEGASLALRIQGLALEPVAEGLRAIVSLPSIQQLGSALKDGGEAPDSSTVIGEVLSTLQQVDLASLGRSLGAVFARADALELVRAVLSRTARDGRRLSEPAYFDAAYERNYLEMQRAALEVVQYNGFFPLAELLMASGTEKQTGEETAPSPGPSSPRARRSGRRVSPS